MAWSSPSPKVIIIQRDPSIASSASRTSWAPSAYSSSSSSSTRSSNWSGSDRSYRSYVSAMDRQYGPEYYRGDADYRSPLAANYRVPVSYSGNNVVYQHNAGYANPDVLTANSYPANNSYYRSYHSNQ